jgi:hypothetical protein
VKLQSLVCVLALGLSACSSPQIDACERWAVSQLKMPESYQARERRQLDVESSGRDTRMVRIYFSATNRSGRAQLNEAMCSFPLRNGAAGPLDPKNSWILPGPTEPQSALK